MGLCTIACGQVLPQSCAANDELPTNDRLTCIHSPQYQTRMHHQPVNDLTM